MDLKTIFNLHAIENCAVMIIAYLGFYNKNYTLDVGRLGEVYFVNLF
jgi:hypothetical protein